MKDQNTTIPQVDILQQQLSSIEHSLSHTTTTSSNSSSSLPERPATSTQSQTKSNRLSLTAGRLFTSRSRSRSKSPAPSDIPTTTRSRRSDSESTYILKSDKMARISIPRRSASPTEMSTPASPSSIRETHSTKCRSDSYHSRKSSDDYRRYSGTVNHYGRHSNDWLFGGFSLRDTVRGGVDRLRQRDDKS
ncbi:hypothetical protein ABOM_005716 [Aspergillus bombycis]|uniref:Uncharacterized protein n=1 Tax=Aspergillus bombycis TaxID=109264 RepID=A0A1F8A333_9EURO|nr:hypothetical protein ABOM_005716 [Aspergillus bombycis]OGM46111.1 hypothetical protein ABOM_005716 [Aspergillus bombycis]